MNTTKSTASIKLGIYAMSILMMGVVGVSGSLTVIGEHFSDASQSMIQSIISIPCLTVLPATIISGRAMDHVSKKSLGMVGIVLFLIGGVVPAWLTSLPLILVFRGLFGIGIGIIQPTGSALVAENFIGAERDAVQGTMTSAQMLGCAIMVFAGGWLGSVAWNVTFYVHGIAAIILILVAVCLPNVAPAKRTDTGRAHKTTLNKSSWCWAAIMFALYIGVQIYTVYMSYLLEEKSLGSAAQAGTAVAVACIGGFLMGLLFGKLTARAKDLTLAIGLFCMALSYIVIALAGNMVAIFVGSFIYGLAMAICMPVVIVNTANSVDAFSAAMAISITMCTQNLAQFICPYLLNTVIALLGDDAHANEWAYLLGAGLLIVMGVGAIFWGGRKSAREMAK